MKGMMRRLAMLAIAMPVFAGQAAEQLLADFPFWRANEGWWRSDNTYFDSHLDYNIRGYNSVVHIELDGRTYRETEYKSYPAGKMATGLGMGQARADEGVETVTVTVGELVDGSGTVRVTATIPAFPGSELTEFRPLGVDTGMRATRNPATGFDSYRMLVTLPAPDKRYVANFGLVSGTTGPGAAHAAPDAAVGDLRGFSLFRASRIAGDEVEKWRQSFRELNKVAVVVEAGSDGKPVARRLNAQSRSQ